MKNKKKNPYNLPSTRAQLFFDVIKQRWRTLILIGLILFLFALPMIACLFLRDYFVGVALLNEEDPTLGLALIYCGFSLCILILAIGISGVSKIYLHLSYEEGFDFKEDFKIGVKQNIKTNIIATLIYAIILYMVLFINISVSSPFIKYAPLGMCQGIVFPILMVIIASNSIYDWKFKDSLRNGGIIYIRYFLFILIFSFLLFGLYLLLLLRLNIILKYAIFAVVFIIIEPFIILGFVIFMNHCFDEGINKNNYPTLYRKGLFKAKQEIFPENLTKN